MFPRIILTLQLLLMVLLNVNVVEKEFWKYNVHLVYRMRCPKLQSLKTHLSSCIEANEKYEFKKNCLLHSMPRRLVKWHLEIFHFVILSCTQRRTSMLKEFTILLRVIVRVSEGILYPFCIAKHSLNMLKYKYETCAAELEDSCYCS